MKKITVLCILFLSATTVCLGQANRTESSTINTYYPSPTGVYANIRLNPAGSTPAGINQTGVMFFNNTTNTIQFYNRTRNLINLTGGSGSVGGNWEYNSSTEAINTTNFTSNFTVLINGKAADGDILKVRGDMRIRDSGRDPTNEAILYIIRKTTSNSSAVRFYTSDDPLDQYKLWMKGAGIFAISNSTNDFMLFNRTDGRVTIGGREDPWNDDINQLQILGDLNGGSPKQTVVKLEGDGEIALTLEATDQANYENCPVINAYRARDRYSNFMGVKANDSLFYIDGRGWNGTGYSSAGGYRMSAAKDYDASFIASKFSFYTTPVSSTDPVERFMFNASNGRIGIGTLNPGYPLQVNVTSSVYGFMKSDGTWGYSSDKRFKKNVSGIEDALAKVLRVKGVRYDPRSEKSSPGKKGKLFGFIGQDLEKVMPELVETGPGGYRSVSYGSITPVLVEAIKENQKDIESLRKEIEELKAQK